MASITKRPRNKRNPWVVRYRDSAGHQREEAFPTWNAAQRYRAEVEHSASVGTFQDPRLASVPFTEYAARVVENMAVTESTRKLYRGMVGTWLAPWAGGRTLGQVANDRDGATDLLNRDMRSDAGLLSYNRRGIARAILLATLDDAVASGKLNSHRLAGIKLIRQDSMPTHDDFVFPSYDQISALAESLNGFGIAVWLARGCGLRIREALAVHREDFIDRGRVLRVSRQASVNGDCAEALKHRRPGQSRDVAVPAYVWDRVKLLAPHGPVCASGNSNPYPSYSVVYKNFSNQARKLGIPEGFTPHSLRHSFATDLLRSGVPIHIVSQMLGHRSVEVTSRVYAHVLRSDFGDVRSVLDSAYAAWSTPENMPAVA